MGNDVTELIDVKIDGRTIQVPNGTLIIRAAEKAGVIIPRFCDHPLLKPVAACRQCLVEVARPGRDGTVAKMPVPVPACAERVSPGTEVYTQNSSEVAAKAQEGVMEFLLLNHPLDCPICDKGGECPLQNQAMTAGRTNSRFTDEKRTFPKPLQVAPSILLDRDRCVLCQRCARFQKEIAGDPFIQLQGRAGGSPGYHVHALHGSQMGQFDAAALDFCESDGSHPEIHSNGYSDPFGKPGIAEGYEAGPLSVGEADVEGRLFTSYFSGNTVQICPVGALTSSSYRFRARPFDLRSVPSVATQDASGAATRLDVRRAELVRVQAGEDNEVNEEWITDKERWAFTWQSDAKRLKRARVNGAEVGYRDAVRAAADGVKRAKDNGGVAVLTGGRLPMEDAYAYSKFARVVLGTNDIDFRTRPVSAEEESFLGSAVAGSGLGVTYTDLDNATHVVTVGFESEEECGTVFLRLRKAVLAGKTSVTVLAPFASEGTKKLSARLIPTVPGDEARHLDALSAGDETYDGLAAGGVILVGERAGAMPGALSAALRLAERTGARLAWIPRRAGDRGALEVGATPHMLPGGRPVVVTAAREEVAHKWGVDSLPENAGRNTEQIIEALKSGELAGVILAGVDMADLPAGAAEALEAASFVLSLEVRESEVSAVADVVLPVAPPSEKGGSFVNWEGRIRPFGQALTSVTKPDRVVLNDVAEECGYELGLPTLADAVKEVTSFFGYAGARLKAPEDAASVLLEPLNGPQARVASWNLMLGAGILVMAEDNLASAARAPYAVLSEATAKAAGLSGERVVLSAAGGSVELPFRTDSQIPDAVVWIPQHSQGCRLADLGVQAGQTVTLSSSSEVTQ